MLKLLQVVSTKQPSSRRHSRSNPTLWTIREKVTALAGAQPLVSLLKHAYSFGALPNMVQFALPMCEALPVRSRDVA
jgi:hypothetical protein